VNFFSKPKISLNFFDDFKKKEKKGIWSRIFQDFVFGCLNAIIIIINK